MKSQSPDWAKELQQALSQFETEYQICLSSHNDEAGAFELRERLEVDAEPIDGARIYLTKALGAVMEALCKLPEFSKMNGVGLGPLRDLAVAMFDLNNGNRSPLLATRKVNSRAMKLGQVERQAGVVSMVRLFEAAGLNNANSRKQVANCFGSAGLSGRKSGTSPSPISAQTIFDWQVAIESEASDGPRKRLVAQYAAEFFSKPNFVPTLAEAKVLADYMARSDMFKTRI